MFKLKDRLYRLRFARACQRIYATPPLTPQTDQPVAVLTQLQHKDVLLFLIATKSFARQVPLREVFILNDGSLTRQDQALLKHHLPHARLLSIAAFSHPSCPRGGAWERLLAIAQFSQGFYLIQLDSDTLTRASLPEVCQAIETGTAFVLGTYDRQEIEPMRLVSERVRSKHPNAPSHHVQLAAEAAFAELEAVDQLQYVRGCSGFCGFPPGTVKLEFILEFSQAMARLLGPKWQQWGSEQVMSNVVVANAPRACVLPHPDYSNCDKMTETTRFVHFIGSCRFQGGRYAREASRLIAELEAGHVA